VNVGVVQKYFHLQKRKPPPLNTTLSGTVNVLKSRAQFIVDSIMCTQHRKDMWH